MNKPTLPITTALRQIIAEVAPTEKMEFVFSDDRRPAKGVNAVGVKFSFVQFTNEQADKIVQQMKDRGYTFHYHRFNSNGNSIWGHRFCFSI